jgi:hypothetical protein
METAISILSLVVVVGLVIAFRKRDDLIAWLKERHLQNRRNKIYESATPEQRTKRTKIVEESKNYHNFSSWNEENELLKFECLSIEEMEAKLEVWKAEKEKAEAKAKEARKEAEAMEKKLEAERHKLIDDLRNTDLVLTTSGQYKLLKGENDYSDGEDENFQGAVTALNEWLEENLSTTEYEEYCDGWTEHIEQGHIERESWYEILTQIANSKKQSVLKLRKKEQANAKSNGGNG